ncbi:hypothetical protein LTR16_003003 [Cryomyces antarcticus]|uniref:AB hydrolase-1 domain-containing protein n=1 Tax=Cryomyces antarcticus TaxID=329879 RepID=A0ABR0M7F7_9PEZI|nr:hypothetical protein LTR60_002158 [Cryomyces antarcticus]KAK5017102.1 hypothetical protein LTR39_001726 [Cryomyces antarcticus]KAK5289423.1 hypothetical protein LTR16_003003 [Cryomyces antarcticus]
MATPNPMEHTHGGSPPAAISKKVYTIAGILTAVYGLAELSSQVNEVACLWLLHPRLQTQECMEPVAASIIHSWNARLQEGRGGRSPKGLIAVSFDQRNHGSREVNKLANEAWRAGNPTHAQDMFSIYRISLGGHAAWHCVLHDARISTAVIVIGCPDYTRLMTDRAKKSKLQTWVSTERPGAQFLGSVDFPKGLIETIERYDPAGLLMGELDVVTGDDHLHEPSDEEKTRLRPLMREHLGGKRILCLSGGADKLVPYQCGEPFLGFLKRAIGEGGWFSDRETVLEDIVDIQAGHEFSPKMKEEAIRFIGETLLGKGGMHAGTRSSKI